MDHVVEWNIDEGFPAPNWAEVPAGSSALVASVRSEEENQNLAQVLDGCGYQVVFPQVVSEKNGLICGYRDSSQLGVDRWLAMLACWDKIQSSFVLVSAGTALTIDLVYATGKHAGGYIVAGLGLAREALISRSEKLRLQYADSPPVLEMGVDTAAAINNGALVAAVEMIRGAQRSVGMSKSDLVISGGDAELLARHLGGATTWNNIVLDGLAVWSNSSASDE